MKKTVVGLGLLLAFSLSSDPAFAAGASHADYLKKYEGPGERRVVLCPDGTFRGGRGSSYSGVVQATASHAFCGNFAITGAPPFGIDPFDPFRRDLGLHA